MTGINGLAEPLSQAVIKVPGAEPLPEYRLIEPLGKGGYGEVWKCEVPGGLIKAIKFVPRAASPLNGDGTPAAQELRALEHIKTIRHPFMLSVERVEVRGAELLIVMELADRSLTELLAEHQEAGRPGIPRTRLLAFLREAAEVLDFMSFEHQLQHLDIKPGNLFVVSNHIKVADFGMVDSIAPRQGETMRAVTPLYAAPELFNGEISPFSDQYSLAITYQALLTGTFPFQGKNARQLMLSHLTAEPKLEALPDGDRPLLARALAKSPERRFRSCLEFVDSLLHGKEIEGKETISVTPGKATERSQGRPTLKEESAVDESIDRETLARMALLPPQDAIPGYEFQECLRLHPVGDTWRVQAPDGRLRLAKSLNVARNGPALVAQLKQLRHPALPRTDIMASPSGRIFLIFDPASQTLRDRHKECRGDGLPGIPRQELLAYLARAAAALDQMYRDLHLVHLSLNPHNIWLDDDQVLLFEFALVPLLWQAQGKAAGPVNSRYAAPELFDAAAAGEKSRSDGGVLADQYSLALIYAEALTGLNPKSSRGSSRGSGSGSTKLNLDLLPACDRPIIARALHSDPRQRFATCSDFAQALQQCLSAEAGAETSLFRKLPPLLPLPGAQGDAVGPESSWPTVEKVVTDWVLAATGAIHIGQLTQEHQHYLLLPGNIVEHRCPIRIIPGGLKLKLHDYPKQWQAQLLEQDDRTFVCRIPAARTLWQRCFSGASGMEVQVRLQPFGDTSQLVEATIRIEPYGAANAQLAKKISEVGPALIESVRTYLQPETGERAHERWPCDLPWHVYPARGDGSLREPLEAVGKDISLGGIGFRAPSSFQGDHFYLSLSHASAAPFAILTHVRRNEPGVEGWRSIGVAFGQQAHGIG